MAVLGEVVVDLRCTPLSGPPQALQIEPIATDKPRIGSSLMPLHPGDAFPGLSLTVPGGETLNIPDAFAGQFGVILFIRGAWCPYCNAQLRAFNRARVILREAGVRVAALSVDDEVTTAALVVRHGLTFPVGFGADARAVAALTGAFVNPGPVYLQPTGFVLDPRGNVLVSVYSSGAIGRLVPEDIAGLVNYVRERTGAQSRSASPAARLPR